MRMTNGEQEREQQKTSDSNLMILRAAAAGEAPLMGAARSGQRAVRTLVT
jgi:hypothetical protein